MKRHVEDWRWLLVLYELGAAATWVYLTFFNGFRYNWWNWIVVMTINPFLAEIWPIYWGVILPLDRYVINPLSGGNHWLAIGGLLVLLVAWFWLVGRRPPRS